MTDRKTLPSTLLRKAWVNERASPEILPYQEEFIKDVKKLVAEQQNIVLEARGNPEKDFECNLYQMDIDRISFLLASYLRTRLKKIERHVLYMLSHKEMNNRLSPQEREFAEGYLDLLENHFNASFLSQIPDKFREIGQRAMIEEPNLQTHVLFQVQQPVKNFELGETQQAYDFEVGDIIASRYVHFKQLLADGIVDLL